VGESTYAGTKINEHPEKGTANGDKQRKRACRPEKESRVGPGDAARERGAKVLKSYGLLMHPWPASGKWEEGQEGRGQGMFKIKRKRRSESVKPGVKNEVYSITRRTEQEDRG